jgi:hypothetical protein
MMQIMRSTLKNCRRDATTITAIILFLNCQRPNVELTFSSDDPSGKYARTRSSNNYDFESMYWTCILRHFGYNSNWSALQHQSLV